MKVAQRNNGGDKDTRWFPKPTPGEQPQGQNSSAAQQCRWQEGSVPREPRNPAEKCHHRGNQRWRVELPRWIGSVEFSVIPQHGGVDTFVEVFNRFAF